MIALRLRRPRGGLRGQGSGETPSAAAATLLDARDGVASLARLVGRRTAIVTPLGWSVSVLGIAAWIAGAQLGWTELELVAGSCLVLWLLVLVFAFGRAELEVTVRLDPPRVVVGEPASGEVSVRNIAPRRLLPLPVEIPVGRGVARYDVPTLAGGEEYLEPLVVSTERRAVISIGPATSVRGDPLGIVRREVEFGDIIELYVHPRTTALDTLGSGFLRDLEGNTTEAISPSDLAFHSLRGYMPGDDRRHIHWRTSARTGELMVRQFLDTRRSHLAIVVDCAPGSYATEAEFELGISVAASLAQRAARDDQDVSVVAGGIAERAAGVHVLDPFSRATLDEEGDPLSILTTQSASRFPDASLALLVTGSLHDHGELRRAASTFDFDTKVLGLVADLSAAPTVRESTGLTVLEIGSLGDLPRLVAGVIAQ